MRYFLIILISASLFSCESKETSQENTIYDKPENLLSREVFTNIFEDVYLTEAAIRNEITKGAKKKDITIYLFDELFTKHQISEKDYIESLKYYSRDPIIMQEIQTEVVNRLTKLESTLNNQ